MAKDEKAALYKRLVERADPHLLAARMRTLGFWPENVPIPDEPEAAKHERAELEHAVQRLLKKGAIVKDPESALAKERVRRWEESKARRAANKAERDAQKRQCREEFLALKQTTVVHAGEQVSAGLSDRQSDHARLGARGLPILDRPEQVAAQIGISLPRLRWLTYHRRSVALVHYHRYQIPKKTGGIRHISAPKRSLGDAQHWLLDNVLAKLEATDQAHGFLPGRSAVTNAAMHVGKAVVINVDLRDFFPSIGFTRVRGLFKKLGYSGAVASIFALLCSEAPRVVTELDGKAYFVALSERVLPQGACTSPAITNFICRRLDRRLAGLAARFGFSYTRYADDLTFSSDDPTNVGRLLGAVRRILTSEGFSENGAKTRIMRRGRKQEVTGLSVNSKVSVPRRERRLLRAMLHNAARHGLESQNRANHPRFADYLRGRVAYVTMVHPEQREELRLMLARAVAKR